MGKVFYNFDMAKVVRNIPVPVKGLKLDIRGRPNYIAVTVYEENIMDYTTGQQKEIMKYLNLVRDTIRSYGTPCEIEGIQYVKGRVIEY